MQSLLMHMAPRAREFLTELLHIHNVLMSFDAVIVFAHCA